MLLRALLSSRQALSERSSSRTKLTNNDIRVDDDDHEESFDLKNPATWRVLFTRQNLPSTLIGATFLAIIILFAIFQSTIVHDLQPAADWMKSHSGGWLIPIVIIAATCIPPIIGHDIFAILVGVTWGLWIGFGIVCAGTFIGEFITFLLSKYLLSRQIQRLATRIRLATRLTCMYHLYGWKVALAVRCSFLPSHLSIALFAAFGLSLPTFVLTAIPAFLKMFSSVSIGVLLNTNLSKSERGASIAMLVLSIAVSILSRLYMRRLEETSQARLKAMMREFRTTGQLSND